MVDRQDLESLLFAAGFSLVRERSDIALYTHREQGRLTLRTGVRGFLAAGTVARAIEAVEQVVICDET